MLGQVLAGPAEQILAGPPSDIEEFNAVTVSPGLPGFIAMFVLAVGVVLLVIDMTRRMRRVRATERVERRMAAQRTEQEQADLGRSAGPDAAGAADDGGSSDAAENREQGDGGPGDEGPGSVPEDPADPKGD